MYYYYSGALYADKLSDLDSIKNIHKGMKCYVIEQGNEYIMNSENKWYPRTAAAANEVPEIDLSNYITREEFENSKVSTTFGEDPEAMAQNPGSQFGIAINKDETKTIIDAMKEKGIGLYTFWIHKSSSDLPAEAIAKNSSCRGLCCVDTMKETGWYGWIQLFDHDGYMYTRYIRNSEPTEWRSC